MRLTALSLIFVAALFAGALARADFYSCKTPRGKTVLSSVKVPGECRLIREVKKIGVPKAEAPAKAKKPATRPANFPRVSPAAQKRRDLARRRILADELAQEERHAVRVEKQLAAGRATGAPDRRIRAWEYQAMRHRENIAAITRELRRLR